MKIISNRYNQRIFMKLLLLITIVIVLRKGVPVWNAVVIFIPIRKHILRMCLMRASIVPSLYVDLRPWKWKAIWILWPRNARNLSSGSMLADRNSCVYPLTWRWRASWKRRRKIRTSTFRSWGYEDRNCWGEARTWSSRETPASYQSTPMCLKTTA